MKMSCAWIGTAAIVVALLMPSTVLGETITIPFGTTVFCELDQKVTSKKRKWSEGDLVKAHVWKDVRVGTHIVIKAGTPVIMKISKLQKARIAGQKGSLELTALSVLGADGVDIPLQGGYDKSGKGRVGLSVSLGVLVFAPLVFIKGGEAVLKRGTIFDAMVRNPTKIEVDTATKRPVLRMPSALNVAVIYDEIDMDAQTVLLPMSISTDQPFERVEIVAINDKPLETPLQLDMVSAPVDGSVKVTTPLKALAKMMSQGMNRLSVKAGEETEEVLLEIEF
tara:strand:- start:67 stop:906 length:840 start_codon:yes stop_codon:yes gene_type:complete